jgi:putrescine transport system substrate-binding protein
MIRHQPLSIAVLCVLATLMLGCDGPHSGTRDSPSGEKSGDERVLNLYIWSDFLAPNTLSSFEELTGIKVHVSYFDTNETLEARMLTGNSGFDVVAPVAPYMQREIRSGAYLLLDKKQLPNLANLDPAVMSRVALNDPGNAHSVVYTWGTFGIGYNRKKVAEALPNTPIDSWRVLFDPLFAAKLATCGINILDTPAGVTRLVLNYLGKNPNAPSPKDLAEVEAVLAKIRPYIRTIDSSSYIEAIANGDICIALGYNGDIVQARNRGKEAKNGITIDYVIPAEGSLLWFTMLAIPKDAPHVANAHLFINYLMNPQVIASITNAVGFANAVPVSSPLLNASIASDTAIYPTPDEQRRLFVQAEDPPGQSRAITRMWQKFKTGE